MLSFIVQASFDQINGFYHQQMPNYGFVMTEEGGDMPHTMFFAGETSLASVLIVNAVPVSVETYRDGPFYVLVGYFGLPD